jgi:hypothetical protein
MKNSILTLTLLSLVVACGKKQENEESLSVDSLEAVVESGVTMISGMADEQSGSSLALKSNSNEMRPKVLDFILPTAYAVNCTRAFYQSCDNGIKSIDYSSCDIPGTSRSLDGQIQLSYSDLSCSLSNDGDSVTRTYDLSITGVRGGQISHSSSEQKDYREEVYGGGGRLTRTAAGWDLDILGRHSQLNFRGREIYDTSIRTLNTIEITGSLSRANRLITSGQIEVNHNKAEFTATMTPNNLQWTSSCCHPTSGSLNVVFSGSRTGNATVTFGEACGIATVDNDGQSNSIQLSYCE